jgi:hypothetical protein
MNQAIFYRAGCPAYQAAEQMPIKTINTAQYQLKMLRLKEQLSKLSAAQRSGVKSVSALVLNQRIDQINFGAALAVLNA